VCYIKRKISASTIADVTMTYALVPSSFNTLTVMSPLCDLERIRHFANIKIENSQIAIIGINKNFMTLPLFQLYFIRLCLNTL